MPDYCCIAMNAALKLNGGHFSKEPGFTMLELLAAITIVGILLTVAVPSSARFFESMQYQRSVRDVITLLASARHRAISSGSAQDVVVKPQSNMLTLNEESIQLPAAVNLTVHSAREVNRGNAGVIRFYPEGGSSGGDIEIERPGRGGVKISVDWLVGTVTQGKYALE